MNSLLLTLTALFILVLSALFAAPLFIDWNDFWRSDGKMGPDGYVIPKEEHLQKLFMRKPGLPILKVRFPDGSDRPYWNTFYQEVHYQPLTAEDLQAIDGLPSDQAESIMFRVNTAIAAQDVDAVRSPDR